MKRDICYFFPVDVITLYNAYLTAATNPPFERDCKKEPFHTISFGVNYSFKYNMNGGSCIMRFIPCGGGAAVNLRFTLAQAAGGRCERYAEDLTKNVVKILNIPAQKSPIDVEEFLKDENKVVENRQPQSTPVQQYTPQPQPVAQSVTQAAPAPQPVQVQKNENSILCKNCGATLTVGAAFCGNCGASQSVKKAFCEKCGAKALEGAAFCHMCGNKL